MKKSRRFEKLIKILNKKKLKGVRLKPKSICRKDPALGSGDSVWGNEWDKLGGFSSSAIHHLVILSPNLV
jgi:hypothetical protein